MGTAARSLWWLSIFVLAFTFTLLIKVTPAVAQQATGNNPSLGSSLGIATYISIKGKDITDGSIISFGSAGYVLSKIAYDPLMIGIVTTTPAVAIVEDTVNAYPVVSSGNTNVNVTGENGVIKKGDLITTSTTPGYGQKGDRSGYVIGSALQDFPGKTSNDVGKIAVAVNIHYFSTKPKTQASLFDVFNLAAIATYEEPTTVFKYFAALLIVVFSFIFGFWFFGRAANRGIEAIGRNPLAGKTIQMGILMNVMLSVAIIIAGLVVSFFVLRL
jgi:F0F1-type ATP synthase membrane subunit c/vacuolar-type H+-ATPase subunit K